LTGTIACINQDGVARCLDNICADASEDLPILIEQVLVGLPVCKSRCREKKRGAEERIAIRQIRDPNGTESNMLLWCCCDHVYLHPFNEIYSLSGTRSSDHSIRRKNLASDGIPAGFRHLSEGCLIKAQLTSIDLQSQSERHPLRQFADDREGQILQDVAARSGPAVL
jgi:hypothetical protein